MKISELVKELREISEGDGDLPVYVSDGYDESSMDYAEVIILPAREPTNYDPFGLPKRLTIEIKGLGA